MRISRLYVDIPLSPGQTVALPSASAHYVRNVLRLKQGTPLILFNGDGREYQGNISLLDKKALNVGIGEASEPSRESPLHSHLGVGLSRGERMDFVIQKCTELGATEITPLFTEHCEVKLQGERIDKRLAHWQQVAISACEQSGRLRLPLIRPPLALPQWLAGCNSQWKFVLDQRQQQNLPAGEVVDSLALLSGPEGGLTETEIQAAVKHGFQPVCLGARVLRTETAPLAALSVAQWLWGDF